VRAKKERAARGVRRPDSWSPRRSREGDDPDRRGPPVGGRERKGKTEWAAREEMGRGVGLGPAGREREREREKEWVGLKGDRVRERFLFFFFLTKAFKQFNSNSNSRIQIRTEQQAIKQCIAA